jgi:uncharacterized DUF497 family protein
MACVVRVVASRTAGKKTSFDGRQECYSGFNLLASPASILQRGVFMSTNTSPDFERALDLVEWTVYHRSYGRHRAQKVLGYCKEHGLSLDEVVIERHDDFHWNGRNNRTDREKRAARIGYTNSCYGYLVDMYWVMPK